MAFSDWRPKVVVMGSGGDAPAGSAWRRRAVVLFLLFVAGVVGFGLMLGFDLAPISWLGVAVELCAVAAAWVFVDRRARSTQWGWRHIAALGYRRFSPAR